MSAPRSVSGPEAMAIVAKLGRRSPAQLSRAADEVLGGKEPELGPRFRSEETKAGETGKEG